MLAELRESFLQLYTSRELPFYLLACFFSDGAKGPYTPCRMLVAFLSVPAAKV